MRGKRERVAAFFVADSEIAAGLAPFRAVWSDPAASGPKMREKVSEFVAQSAIDLGFAMFVQAKIQRDDVLSAIRASRGGAQAAVPFHANFWGELVDANGAQHSARSQLERGIAA